MDDTNKIEKIEQRRFNHKVFWGIFTVFTMWYLLSSYPDFESSRYRYILFCAFMYAWHMNIKFGYVYREHNELQDRVEELENQLLQDNHYPFN